MNNVNSASQICSDICGCVEMSNYPRSCSQFLTAASSSRPDKLSVNNSPATVLPQSSSAAFHPACPSLSALGLPNFLFLPGRREAPAASRDLPGQHLSLSLSLTAIVRDRFWQHLGAACPGPLSLSYQLCWEMKYFLEI